MGSFHQRTDIPASGVLSIFEQEAAIPPEAGYGGCTLSAAVPQLSPQVLVSASGGNGILILFSAGTSSCFSCPPGQIEHRSGTSALSLRYRQMDVFYLCSGTHYLLFFIISYTREKYKFKTSISPIFVHTWQLPQRW